MKRGHSWTIREVQVNERATRHMALALTEAEASIMHCKDELSTRVRSLKQLLESKKKLSSPKEARARLKKASIAASKMETDVLKLLDSTSFSSSQDRLS